MKRKRVDNNKSEFSPPNKRLKIDENLIREAKDQGYAECIGDERDQEYLTSLSSFDREQELFHRWEVLQDKKTHGGTTKISSAIISRSSSKITSGYKKFEEKSSGEEDTNEIVAPPPPPPPKVVNKPQNDDDEDDYIDQNESSEDEDLEEEDEEFSLTRRKKKERSYSKSKRSRSRDHRKRIRVVDYATLKSCVLTRKKLLKCYEEPYFARMCVNSFVRVFLGNNPKTGDHVYKLAQIDGVEDVEKGYYSDELRRKIYKRLTLKIGSQVKKFKIVHISNEVPSQREFKIWYEKVKEEYKGGKMTTLPTTTQMKAHFRKNINQIHMRYTHTNEEITKKISSRVEKKQYSEMTTFELDQHAMKLRNRIGVLRDENRDGCEESKKCRKELQVVQKERERKRLINQRREDPRLAQLAFKAREKNKVLLKRKSLGGPGQANGGKSKKQKKLDPFHRTQTRSTFLDALMGGTDAPTPVTPVGQFKTKEFENLKRKEKLKRKKKKVQTDKEAHDDIDLDVTDILGGMDEMEISFN